jgi:hypothetical protein
VIEMLGQSRELEAAKSNEEDVVEAELIEEEND